MRVAVIDLGSNSIRLDITEVTPDRNLSLVHREKRVVKLGQDVFHSGVLHPDAKARTLNALIDFKTTAQSLNVSTILAIGTSALREAKDGDQFIEDVRAKTGIILKKISGDEEARLISIAALGDEKIKLKDFVLIDIGGGSTELIFCKDRSIDYRVSLNIGTVRAFDLFLRGNPPVRSREFPEPIAALRRSISAISVNLKEVGPEMRLVGTSGTSRIIAKIVATSDRGTKITLDVISKLVKDLSPLKIEELREIPGMDKERADVILGGAIILEELMGALKINQLVVSDKSLRDGVLLDWIARPAA